jgi:hypothetical protein
MLTEYHLKAFATDKTATCFLDCMPPKKAEFPCSNSFAKTSELKLKCNYKIR